MIKSFISWMGSFCYNLLSFCRWSVDVFYLQLDFNTFWTKYQRNDFNIIITSDRIVSEKCCFDVN